MNADCIVCAALSKTAILDRVKKESLILCPLHSNPSSLTIYFCCCGERKVLFGDDRIELLKKMPTEMTPLLFGGVLIVTGGDHSEKCKNKERRLFAVYPEPGYGAGVTMN